MFRKEHFSSSSVTMKSAVSNYEEGAVSNYESTRYNNLVISCVLI